MMFVYSNATWQGPTRPRQIVSFGFVRLIDRLKFGEKDQSHSIAGSGKVALALVQLCKLSI